MDAGSADCIDIDGSYLEGGGQILRNSVSLSAVLNREIRVRRIRAGRKQPGMRPQHACGVELVRRLTGGWCQGCAVGSSELLFRPGVGEDVGEGETATRADAGTAGSVLLMCQTAIPVLAFGASERTIVMTGGTDVDFSPPSDHFELTLRPLLARMGLECRLVTRRRGFYPRGGGECELTVWPVSGKLKPFVASAAGRVVKFAGVAFACGGVPASVAERIRREARRRLVKEWPDVELDIRVDVGGDCVGSGCGLSLRADTDSGCVLAGSSLGRRGVPAESVAADAVESLAADIRGGACLDEHTQDQLVLPMALADGVSQAACRQLTDHTRTAMMVASRLTGAEFRVGQADGSGCVLLECSGVGYENRRLRVATETRDER